MSEISRKIEVNEAYLREQFSDCSDVVIRSFMLKDETKLLLIYLDGMTRLQSIEDNVLKPLIFSGLPKALIGFNPLPTCLARNGFL